jgi:hypothetical protein
MAMPTYIAALEQDSCWQATAEDKNGDHVAVMPDIRGGQFENNYYLYGGDAYEASMPYSLNGVQELFASYRLKLLRGSIPNAENP